MITDWQYVERVDRNGFVYRGYERILNGKLWDYGFGSINPEEYPKSVVEQKFAASVDWIEKHLGFK